MSPQLQMRRIDCPLCGDAGHDDFLRSEDLEHGTGDDFRLVRCRRCGHVYLNPAPTAETLALCYPDGYGPHRDDDFDRDRDASRVGGGGFPSRDGPGDDGEPQREDVGCTFGGDHPDAQPWYLTRPVRSIPGLRRFYYWLVDTKSQALPPVEPAGRTALELGCATGRFLETLRRRGWEASGVDLVEAPVRQARTRGFDVHLGDLRSAAFAEARFDDVFAWMVIEHLPDPAETLAEIYRIQRPGGWLCFSIPNFASPERRIFGKHWKGYDLPRHLQHFTPGRIRRLLTSSGYEQIRVIHQPDALNWIGSLGSRLLGVVPGGQGSSEISADARPRRDGFRHRQGERLRRWFFQNPPLAVQLALAFPAHLQAALRLSGRLTIQARKPAAR